MNNDRIKSLAEIMMAEVQECMDYAKEHNIPSDKMVYKNGKGEFIVEDIDYRNQRRNEI